MAYVAPAALRRSAMGVMPDVQVLLQAGISSRNCTGGSGDRIGDGAGRLLIGVALSPLVLHCGCIFDALPVDFPQNLGWLACSPIHSSPNWRAPIGSVFKAERAMRMPRLGERENSRVTPSGELY
jgi:hypothetical protein